MTNPDYIETEGVRYALISPESDSDVERVLLESFFVADYKKELPILRIKRRSFASSQLKKTKISNNPFTLYIVTKKMTNKNVIPRVFYGVASGKRVGIFNNWTECEKHVKGYAGAVFKKFKSESEAICYVKTKNPEFTPVPNIIDDSGVIKKKLFLIRASLYATISAIQNNQDEGTPLHIKTSKDIIEGISSVGIENEDQVIPEDMPNYDMWLTLSKEIKSFPKKIIFSSFEDHQPV